jgi:DNA-binding MurR/RpiR family transcriptional regulator
MEDLGQRLRQYMKSGTPAERRIARYFSDHLSELPYETASSVADRLDLSPMTVGRFLRALGYQGLDGFKVHLRETVPPTSSLKNTTTMEQLQKEAAAGKPLAALMAEQLEMLHHVYNISTQPQWTEAVAAILSAGDVFVAAHPTCPLGQYFCDRLGVARDNVRMAGNGSSATYIELLGPSSPDSLLVIIDSHRFAKSRVLARSARRSGLKILLVTGQYTEWAHEFASLTLAVPPPRVGPRDNLTAMSAMLEFLATSAIHAAGQEAEIRARRMAELENMFAEAPMR